MKQKSTEYRKQSR